MVAADRRMAGEEVATFYAGHGEGSGDQAAVCDLPAVRDDAGPREGRVHHHRGGAAPDVGGAALRVRTAEPLDDVWRVGDDGLWVAGGDGGADRASGRTGDR